MDSELGDGVHSTVGGTEEDTALQNYGDHDQESDEPAVTSSKPLDNQVATLAYSYWQERGCPEGCPEEDWYRAEQELAAQRRHRS